jgi:TPR repeat protein/thiol-disulfide isomerase/thioredoxin
MKLRLFAPAVLGILGLVAGCTPDQAKEAKDAKEFKAPTKPERLANAAAPTKPAAPTKSDAPEPPAAKADIPPNIPSAPAPASIAEDIKQAREMLNKFGNTDGFIRKNADKRFTEWQANADKGNAESLWLVGRTQLVGTDAIPIDAEAATKHIRRSAEMGFGLGRNSLGTLLEEGTGVPQNVQEAYKWFLAAAESGEPAAMFTVGDFNAGVVEGFTGKKSDAEGWYRKSADKGFVQAMEKLADLAENRGDSAEATQWYEQLAKSADTSSPMVRLYGLALGGKLKSESASRLRRRLAKVGPEGADILQMSEILVDPIGKKAPNAVGISDGKKFDLKSLSGKVVVVKFSATWCGPCRAMIPHLKELTARMKDKPFELLDIDVDENLELAERWYVTAVPTIYVIDQTGVIRDVGCRGKELDKAVDDLVPAAGK